DIGSIEGDAAAVHRSCERDAFTGGELQPEQDATVPFPLRDLLEFLGAENEIDRIDDERLARVRGPMDDGDVWAEVDRGRGGVCAGECQVRERESSHQMSFPLSCCMTSNSSDQCEEISLMRSRRRASSTAPSSSTTQCARSWSARAYSDSRSFRKLSELSLAQNSIPLSSGDISASPARIMTWRPSSMCCRFTPSSPTRTGIGGWRLSG